MPGSWIWFPILWVCKEKQSCQVRVADPAASVRNVEVAPHARKRFHTLQHENTRVAWCEQNRTDATEIGFISFADAAAANMIHISAVFCLLQVFALPAPLT